MTTSDKSIGSLLGQISQNLLHSLDGGLKVGENNDLPTREERLARRLSLRRDIHPPVDVEKLAKSLAVVSEERFPVNVDGICLNLNTPGKRPEILINIRLRDKRKRFTLAHEIGHVVIPWHMGSIVDDLEAGAEDERDDYFIMEGEANRFAAELLMPRHWATDICKRAEHLSGAMRTIVEVADVSFQAAAVRTVELGPAGYIVSAERNGEIFWSKRTGGTRSRVPLAGTAPQDAVMPAYYDPQILNAGETNYYWWKAREKIPVPDNPIMPWRPILNAILQDLPMGARHSTAQRLNAIIGLAIGRHSKGSSQSDMYQSAVEALQNRNDRDRHLKAALDHPELNNYIIARVAARALEK